MDSGYTRVDWRNRRSGMSLIEIVVYIALVGFVATFLVNAGTQIMTTASRARAEREVIGNARNMLETISKHVVQAAAIYAPTSRFNDNSGQLSLVTAASPTMDHTTTFVDFYVDNGQMWLRREGDPALPISSPNVRVTKFWLERIFQAVGREAVRMVLRVDGSSQKFSTSITLEASPAVRGSY